MRAILFILFVVFLFVRCTYIKGLQKGAETQRKPRLLLFNNFDEWCYQQKARLASHRFFFIAQELNQQQGYAGIACN